MSSRWEYKRRARFYRLGHGVPLLSPRRVALLLCLADCAARGESATLSAMARAADCDPEHAAEVLDELERVGLVEFDGAAFGLTPRARKQIEGATHEG
jgi:predicted transcriptional regulator